MTLIAERFVAVGWTADMEFVGVRVINVPSWKMAQRVMPPAQKLVGKISTLVRIRVIGAVILVKIVDRVDNLANYSAFILDAPDFAEPTAYPAPNHALGPANMLAPATCPVERRAIAFPVISDALFFCPVVTNVLLSVARFALILPSVSSVALQN